MDYVVGGPNTESNDITVTLEIGKHKNTAKNRDF